MADPRTNTFAAFAEDDEPKQQISKVAKEEPKKEDYAEKTGDRRGRRGGRYRNRGPRTTDGDTEGTYERRARRGRGGRYRGYQKEEELTEGKDHPTKEAMGARKFEGDSDKVHPYDRHSGTGTIKPDIKKGGHGKFNIGKPEDDVKEEGNREYKGYGHRRNWDDEKEENDDKPKIETISYKDMLKSQKVVETKEEKKEVKKAETAKPDMSKQKEERKATKYYQEHMHVAALEGDTSKLANIKLYEKRTEDAIVNEKKPFLLVESEFPSLS